MHKEITCTDGNTITRLSRWVEIRHAYDVTPRHSLYDYATDGAGYHPYHEKFNPTDGVYLDYFIFNGKKYALEQFMRCGSPFMPYSAMWNESDGLHVLSGVQEDEYFHPLMIELDEYCERVRVYM